MKPRTLTLELDEADWDTIQTELARRQAGVRWPDGGVVLPEGDSNLAGALIAEMIRDLEEYRAMYDSEHEAG